MRRAPTLLDGVHTNRPLCANSSRMCLSKNAAMQRRNISQHNTVKRSAQTTQHGVPVMGASDRDSWFRYCGTKTIISECPRFVNHVTHSRIPIHENTCLFPCLNIYRLCIAQAKNTYGDYFSTYAIATLLPSIMIVFNAPAEEFKLSPLATTLAGGSRTSKQK